MRAACWNLLHGFVWHTLPTSSGALHSSQQRDLTALPLLSLTLLHQHLHPQVTVAEVDSHKLFRLASDVTALVVLIAEGPDGELPAPHQLAGALRGQRPLDDM